jgi:hypothetical protein
MACTIAPKSRPCRAPDLGLSAQKTEGGSGEVRARLKGTAEIGKSERRYGTLPISQSKFHRETLSTPVDLKRRDNFHRVSTCGR